jgi:SAM-dependent methyltransferase
VQDARRQGWGPCLRARADQDRDGLLTHVAFHDLQQGGRTSDLPYYCELARRSGSTLELGAGTGRVALELAGLTDLWANDADQALLDELSRRADARSLLVTPVPGDATQLALGRRFDLVLAPASFIQIVGGPDARRALLEVMAQHLAATGVAVVAIADVDEILRECATPAPARHLQGATVRQLAATKVDGGAWVTWERTALQADAEIAGLTIHRLSGDGLGAEAQECGLRLARVRHDPGDAATLGTTYCVLHHGPAATPGSSPSARRTPDR